MKKLVLRHFLVQLFGLIGEGGGGDQGENFLHCGTLALEFAPQGGRPIWPCQYEPMEVCESRTI